jgi:hypothetical protein
MKLIHALPYNAWPYWIQFVTFRQDIGGLKFEKNGFDWALGDHFFRN